MQIFIWENLYCGIACAAKQIFFFLLQHAWIIRRRKNYRSCLGNLFYGEVPDYILCKIWFIVPDNVYSKFWRIVYWSSQDLTCITLPLMKSNIKIWDFTVKGKLKSTSSLNLNGQKFEENPSSSSNIWGVIFY